MEITNENLLEDDVTTKTGTIFDRRMDAIKNASQNVSSDNLESSRLQSVKNTVNNLKEQKKEIFPDKEGTLEDMQTREEKAMGDGEPIPTRVETRIMGMHPFLFLLLSVGLIIGGIYVYKKYIKKK